MRTYLNSGGVSKEGLERHAGVQLLNAGVPHSVHRVRGSKGETVFRIYPHLDEKGDEKPLRLEANVYRSLPNVMPGATCDNAFYPWIHSEDFVNMAGVNGTFTIFARVKDKDDSHWGPVRRFLHNMYKALKNNANIFPVEWRDWADKDIKKNKLPMVERAGLLQGCLLKNAGVDMRDQAGTVAPMHPVVLVLPKTGREALEKLCNQRGTPMPGQVPPPEDDFNSWFPYNNLVHSQLGRCIRLRLVPASGVHLTHYTVDVDPNPLAIPPSVLKAEVRPWEALLRFLTEEEQLGLLLQHYPVEAVDYVFGTGQYSDMLPPYVRGRFAQLANRSVSVPPMAPQGWVPPVTSPGQPQAPGAPVVAAPSWVAPPPTPTGPVGPGWPDAPQQQQQQQQQMYAPLYAPPAAAVSAPVQSPPPVWQAQPGPATWAPAVAAPSHAQAPAAYAPWVTGQTAAIPAVAGQPGVSSAVPAVIFPTTPVGASPVAPAVVQAPVGDPLQDQAYMNSIQEKLKAAQAGLVTAQGGTPPRA